MIKAACRLSLYKLTFILLFVIVFQVTTQCFADEGFYIPSRQSHTLQSVLRYRIIDSYMATLAEFYNQFVMAKNIRIIRLMD